jgi:hypothetical protein
MRISPEHIAVHPEWGLSSIIAIGKILLLSISGADG